MSTPGGRANRTIKRLRSLTAFAVAAALFLFLLAGGAFPNGQAKALTPPEATRAEIVFSNGGRLIRMNSDGGARAVLTREGKVSTPGGYSSIGDRFPRVSYDGDQVLFTRQMNEFASDDEFFYHGANFLLDLKTRKLTRILPESRRVSYENLAWIPGTSRVIASKITRGRSEPKSVVSVRLDGTGERTVLRFRKRLGGNPGRSMEAVRFAVSPDRKRVLMTSIDDWSEHGYQLELVDLATGKRKLISKEAHSGSWAPDGTHFVFVADRKDTEVCDWSFDCTPSGDLFTAKADGSGVQRLTNSIRDESNPSFSPDGTRIVFSGTTNDPGNRGSSEIFSMASGGGCIVQLTNGSPASLDPSFLPGSGQLSSPSSCSPVERVALAEARLNPVEKKGFGKRLWLGPRSSQGLLSMDADIVFLSFTVYNDCPFVIAASCPSGAMVMTSPVCFDQGRWADKLANLVKSRKKQRRRGVWMVQHKRRNGFKTTVFSGKRTASISDGFGPGPDSFIAGEMNSAEEWALADELRVKGKPWTENLPKLIVPRFDFRLARAVTNLVERTSIASVMKENHVKKSWVIHQMNFLRNVERLGPIGRTACPDTDDPWGID